MAGCFGNSPYDRYLERQVIKHCDSMECKFEDECTEEDCKDCKRTEEEFEEEDLGYDPDEAYEQWCDREIEEDK